MCLYVIYILVGEQNKALKKAEQNWTKTMSLEPRYVLNCGPAVTPPIKTHPEKIFVTLLFVCVYRHGSQCHAMAFLSIFYKQHGWVQKRKKNLFEPLETRLLLPFLLTHLDLSSVKLPQQTEATASAV